MFEAERNTKVTKGVVDYQVSKFENNHQTWGIGGKRDTRISPLIMAAELNINRNAISYIFNVELRKRKICAKSVPHNVTSTSHQGLVASTALNFKPSLSNTMGRSKQKKSGIIYNPAHLILPKQSFKFNSVRATCHKKALTA